MTWILVVMVMTLSGGVETVVSTTRIPVASEAACWRAFNKNQDSFRKATQTQDYWLQMECATE